MAAHAADGVFELPGITMPWPFAAAAVPLAVVPMKQPATVSPPEDSSVIPVPGQSLIASAWIVELPAATVNTVWDEVKLVPSI